MFFEILGYIILIIVFALAALGLIAIYVEARKYLLKWTNPEEYARRRSIEIAVEKQGETK